MLKYENKLISDIGCRIYADLPLTLPYDLRGHFQKEWNLLEKRIKDNYILKKRIEEVKERARQDAIKEVNVKALQFIENKKKEWEERIRQEIFKRLDEISFEGYVCGELHIKVKDYYALKKEFGVVGK